METLEALAEECGSEEKIWSLMVKQTLKRRRPGFIESDYGFRSFNRLLEEAAAHGLMQSSTMEPLTPPYAQPIQAGGAPGA